MPDAPDLLVVGAGPAGMAAAVEAAERGLSVLVVDDAPAPGGQIYRGIEACPADRRALLGKDYAAGAELVAAFRVGRIDYRPATALWHLAPDLGAAIASDGVATAVRPKQVLLATGALERPFPIPGWTLPGVMTAGAAQIALKAAGSVPEGDVVLAGTGPLLYLVAGQLAAAGISPRAVVDTTGGARALRALPRLPAALGAHRMLAKGTAMLGRLARSPTRWFRGATDLHLLGTGSVEAVSFRHGGRAHRIATRTVLLHHGVVPALQVTLGVGAATRWNAQQLCFLPVLDAWGESSRPGLFIAGDGAGILGAEAAALTGRLAALRIAGRQQGAEVERDAAAIRRKLAPLRRVRAFLDALYRPLDAIRRPADPATIVCRCEAVTAGAIRDTAALSGTGPNQVKFFSRCGMGPCQGRLCGLTVTEVLAETLGRAPDEIGHYRVRSPYRPVTLGEIATLDAATEYQQLTFS